MIETAWKVGDKYFEKESDADYYGQGKGEWGSDESPRMVYIVFDSEEQEYYELANNKPIDFCSVDDKKIKEQALAKLTQKEREVLGL